MTANISSIDDLEILLHSILTASSDGIALVDENSCFVEVNPAFGRLFDMAQEQVVGMDCIELFGGHETSPDLCLLQQALQQKQAVPYIELALEIKGVARSLGLSITPILAASKPLSLVVARNVTAIHDATRMKANFLSMITHELRSPLNAINGYLDLALAGIAGELNEQQQEFVRRARGGSIHLYALIEDLLLVSRADAGQLRLNPEIVSLKEIIANAIEELELLAFDNGISISVDFPNDFPAIYADPVRIQQVLRNLISNALRFTASGGSVSVSASQDAEENFVMVQVSDTGSGIAPEYQQRIFERFYQIPLPTAGRSSGQGLGLAIVKMIVELHGGQVMVESDPRQGSTFSFTLPALLS